MQLFMFYLSHWLVQVCEIDSHMGKNSGAGSGVQENTVLLRKKYNIGIKHVFNTLTSAGPPG